jgi:tetratricopeptide (TPR) repeat protein
MQRIFAVAALLFLCCAASATVAKVPTDARLLEAQQAFDEGVRLHNARQYAEAIPLFERALALQEAVFGEMHLEVARCLNKLGTAHHLQGNYSRAEPLVQRALEIVEAALGENHPEMAAALSNLATLYKAQGNHTRAEPLYQRALAIFEATLGQNHPQVAISPNNLADIYVAQGNYARAEPLYERALTIRKAALGQNHPKVATSLTNLAKSHLAQQRLPEALPLLRSAFSVSEAHLRQEVFGFSEARLADALLFLRIEEEERYTLARVHPGNAHIRHLALSAALLRKGRSVEEISNTSRIIYRGLDQADRKTFERLRALRTQLATLSLAGPGQLAPADYQRRIKTLSDQGDALEANLARRSESLRALKALPPPDAVVDRVAATLPSNSVLVEFVTYRDRSAVRKPGAPLMQPSNELRYLALLLFADGRNHALDLGPAAPIDRAARRLHDALAGRTEDYQLAAQELHALAFRPLVPLLGKVKRLFLSPDGQLSLIPFAALHDGNDFLVDTFDVTVPWVNPARSIVSLTPCCARASCSRACTFQRNNLARAGRTRW